MRHYFIFLFILLVTFFGLVVFWLFGRGEIGKDIPDELVTSTPPVVTVTNFEECVNVVGAVMESYPRQCNYNGQNFVEYIGNELEKQDLIQLTNPRPNQVIDTPLVVTGQARGNWFFEANFPVTLVNWDGLIIAEGFAQAQVDPSDNSEQGWMTEEFVPFSVTLNFEYPTVYDRGSLILHKSNASGLPEHDDALEIPIRFSSTSTVEVLY